MKVGFIGFGNMAKAIVSGWQVKKQKFELYACTRHYERLRQTAASFGVTPCQSADEVIAQSDVVILAIKPYQIEEMLTAVKKQLKGKLLISIAAGYPFAKYETLLEAGTAHISTIPNTPIQVGAGILISEETHSLNDAQMDMFHALFAQIAKIVFVDSEHLSIAGTLAGCAPAYTAMYIEALADAGVKHNLARQTAYELAAQMIAGTGMLYLHAKEHPGCLKDAVCSPGGTTIKGVAALEKRAFRGAIIEAIDAVEGLND